MINSATAGTPAVPSRIREWTGATPLQIDFGFTRADAPWQPGRVKGLEYQELGMAKASHGEISTRHVRLSGEPGDVANDWMAVRADLHFFLVLKGRARLENDAGQSIDLESGLAACQPSLLRYRMFDFSKDFEMFEVLAPAEPEIIRGKNAPLPASDMPRKGQYLRETPESFVKGDGLRRFFSYRDLGTMSLTDGLVHIQAFKAVDIMPNGIGWHRHSDMRQFFWVLEGSAGFGVEERPDLRRIEPGDAVCMPMGRRHTVPSYTQDYTVIEICIPGKYQTEEAKAPA
jgi:mannose-6-phosphate isomerase-like protein (cupin superfamily)